MGNQIYRSMLAPLVSLSAPITEPYWTFYVSSTSICEIISNVWGCPGLYLDFKGTNPTIYL